MNTSGVRGAESSITCPKHRVGPQAEGPGKAVGERGRKGGWQTGTGKGREGPRRLRGRKLTDFMFSTGGSTKREPRLEMMKEVTQKATRSWRRERTISIRCISLQAFSHSPGGGGRESEAGRAGNLNKRTPAQCQARTRQHRGNSGPGVGVGQGVRKEEQEKGRRGGPGTWQHSLLRGGVGVPQVPVTRILFKGVHEPVEVGQFVQLCDVIPVGICKPAGTGVIHLALAIQDLGRG